MANQTAHVAGKKRRMEDQQNQYGTRWNNEAGLSWENPNETSSDGLKDRELQTITENIGNDWHQLGIMLEYTTIQLERLNQVYQSTNFSTKLFMMLSKWRDVVERKGENSRLMLAAAFLDLRNREVAEKVTADLDAAGKYKPKQETAEAIKKIGFDTQTIGPAAFERDSPSTITGGDNSLNVFGGHVDQVHIHHRGSQPHIYPKPAFRGLPENLVRDNAIEHLQSYHNHPSLIGNVRAEGLDCVDGPLKSGSENKIGQNGSENKSSYCSNQFKRKENCLLSQTAVGNLHQHMDSVGTIVTPKGSGTVFRVGEKYVMTAWHVIKDIVTATPNGAEDFGKLEDPRYVVNFKEDPRFPLFESDSYFRLKREVQFLDRNLDIIVLELFVPLGSGQLPPKFRLVPYDFSSYYPLRVSFIGYGNPDSHKKHLEPPCPVVPKGSQTIVAAQNWACDPQRQVMFARIIGQKSTLADPYYSASLDSKIVFSCYMEHGASGAPCISTEDNDSVEVVAVLTEGLPVYFWDLPKDVQQLFPTEYRLECGTTMKAIYESMKQQNPSLADDLFS